MMKPLFIFPCIFLYCLASEFIAEDFEQGPSIAIRLSKRLERSKRGQQDLLQNSDAQSETQIPTKQADNLRGNIKTPDQDNSGTLSVSGSQAEHGVCHYSRNTSVIIKTNSSLTAGAKFMKYAQADNSADCAKKCCDTKGCNEAIFENKKDYSCYLFDCGNPSVCVFAPHNSYISMNFQQMKDKVETSHAHLAIKHESELAGLDNQGSSKDSIVQSTTTTTTTTTTPTTFQPTTLKKRTKIVSLDDVCTPADKCEDRHAECIQGKCRCQEGYIIKYGICRRQCDKHHFECEERGSKSIGVECIELANVCDGIPQCGDGSDEFGCSSNAFKDGSQNEILYQVDANPKKMPTAKFRKIKLKPVGPSVSQHDESSNKLLKQKGQLPIAKYNTETMIKKDKPKEALLNPKEFATSNPPVAQRGKGQQFSNHNTNMNQGWVKSDGSKDLLQENDGNSKKLSLSEDIIQPSSRETDRHRANSASSNRIWNQNQLSQYQKHPDVNPQYVGNRNFISNYPSQHQQLGINQVDNQGFVGSGHKPSGLIAEENQKFAINQPKSYNRLNGDSQEELLSGANNQVQLPQRSRQRYQTANQNYMDSQYISDNSQFPQKQNLYGYSGNNYAYQQKVAATYNNGYPVLQPQNSGINQDGVNYVQNTAQAYNWGDYPNDYMYTDQNSDYSNLAANTAQGYQYAPDNGRVNQDLHNLGNSNRPSDNIKQIHPNGVQVHYQATENKIRGKQQQQPTLSKNMSPDVRPDAQDHPKTRFHTESRMQAANTNTDYKAETDGTVHSNAASTDNGNKDKVNGESENDSVVASSKESTTTRSTSLHQNNSVTQKPIKSSAKFFEHSNYILKKKVVVASPSDNAQGPIVALALGLSFTTMLLIFVGCRLHRVKRRLRKGRALHSNEADYLINGMYL
ncbi:uncharacterized protein LOC106881458 isoform X1 [Octopus bimaculoides]|uniref:MANSC domain-containing protein n=1 Tax=Octopus bimaculoides TaxID=37653 RepID=A0A0L8FTA4_OCTBM|nr:uncharacterized protein LOC106881458 isoform X1 [Octopus bimaculoides]|eukprot:XP_014787336.1 PREDICTED: uncharacterized protein LOC106881458 isoform X1 [Octopus bimaculoides]